MPSDTHVIPINDLMPHDERRECWCCPELQAVTDDGDCGVVVVHHALDMREVRKA